jgi:hypothetical protein
MVQASPRTGFIDSTLTRLLARLCATDPRASRHSAADRLSEWTSWTAAISLSAALSGVPAGAQGGRNAAPSDDALEAECRSVRAALARSIAQAHGEAANATPTLVFKPYRQRYLARQQALEAGLGPLRERLRAALAARSPALARLAAVDAVMAQVIDGRERQLLASVPQVLEKHFIRLRDGASTAQDDADATWLNVFQQDARDALLAELDFRYQPIEGLLEALRARQQQASG